MPSPSSKGLLALAFGALSLGVTEFVVMGLLPYIAADFNVSTAAAGSTVSFYAGGVVCGAFIMPLCVRFRLKSLLLSVMAIHFLSNILTALAPSYELLLASRFIAGLPHGCFFGIGAIIAQRIAAKGKGASAIAIMVAGQSIAQVCGVPLGTSLAYFISWRAIFVLLILWSALVLLAFYRWIPDVGSQPNHSILAQFAFLRRRGPYLVLTGVFIGNASIFTLLTYVSPILTDLVGIDLGTVPAVLIANGLCMVLFNLLAGRLCNRFHPGGLACIIQILACLFLLGIAALGQVTAVGVILVIITAGFLFGLSAPEQISILNTSKGGELLGAALGQVAFNFGTVIGSYVGGIPLELELVLPMITIFGAVLAVVGLVSLLIYAKFDEKKYLTDSEIRIEIPRSAAAGKDLA